MRIRFAVILAAALLWAAPFAFALAAEVPSAPAQAGVMESLAAPSQAGQAPLDLDELSRISGGQAVTVVATDQALSAINTGNSINAGSVRAGDINFSQQALSNFAGVGNFVVNTGNNNNLQGSLSVTVVAAPATVR